MEEEISLEAALKQCGDYKSKYEECKQKNKFYEDKLAQQVKDIVQLENMIKDINVGTISPQKGQNKSSDAKKPTRPTKTPKTKNPDNSAVATLKILISELKEKIVEEDRMNKARLHYMQNPHLLHLPTGVVEMEKLKIEIENVNGDLSRIRKERDGLKSYKERAIKLECELKDQIKSLTQNNEALKQSIADLTNDFTEKVAELERVSEQLTEWKQSYCNLKTDCTVKIAELESVSKKLTEAEQSYSNLKTDFTKIGAQLGRVTTELTSMAQSYSNAQTQLTKSNSKVEELSTAIIEQQEENIRIQNSSEIDHKRIMKLLEQANRDAQKYNEEANKMKNENKIITNNSSKKLAQMKKMVFSLTNFMALQHEDDDGSGAVHMVFQVKSMLDMKDPTEQECGLNAIYNLISNKSRDKIRNINGLDLKMVGLTQSQYEYVMAAAKRTLAKLNSDLTNPQDGKGPNISCAYFGTCKAFMSTLGIDAFIEPAYNYCYCVDCHASRGDRLYYTRGIPAKDYGIPVGWTRFTLKVNEGKATTQKIWDDWHVAFHGTKQETVKPILGVGYLVNPGDTIIGGQRIGVREGHISESDSVRKIFMSPSIRYSGNEVYATASTFADNHHAYKVRVAFQVRVKPGSYEVRTETIGAKSQIDPAYLNEELEWCTNEHGSTILQGVLIKLEKIC